MGKDFSMLCLRLTNYAVTEPKKGSPKTWTARFFFHKLMVSLDVVRHLVLGTLLVVQICIVSTEMFVFLEVLIQDRCCMVPFDRGRFGS